MVVVLGEQRDSLIARRGIHDGHAIIMEISVCQASCIQARGLNAAVPSSTLSLSFFPR